MRNHPIRKAVLAGLAAGLFAATAHADPIAYEGVLVPGLPSTGSVNGFSWFLGQAGGVDFWSFSAAAGTVVGFNVQRLNANLDPTLSLYSGTTSADTSLYQSEASFGGMTYLGSLDDEAAPFLQPGPSGDPFGSFVINTGGLYTVAVGGNGSTDAGGYPYRITMSVTPVPEPAAWALLVAGLGAVGWLRRRRAA